MKRTLAQLGNALSHAMTRERVCEACGSEFSCGASLRGCWCSEINLTGANRSELQGRYRDCLCRECLEKISAKESTTNNLK